MAKEIVYTCIADMFCKATVPLATKWLYNVSDHVTITLIANIWKMLA